jgi:hypothetical protein
MAFDVQAFVDKQTASLKKPGGFNVDEFLLKQGIQPKRDLSTVEGLAAKAKDVGLEDKANAILNETPKLSFLQRLGKGLGAFNPAEAVLTAKEKGIVRGIAEYPKNIIEGVGSAITGRDYESERRTFADVAEKYGITNGIAKFGIGFLGDVFLDPTTYFGGAIARGITGGTVKVADAALTTAGRFAPTLEASVRAGATGVKDAFGKALVFGYGASKGLPEKALEVSGKLSKAKEGIVLSNIERLGTGTLSKTQQEELVGKLLAGKRAEFDAGRGIAGKTAAVEAAKSSDPVVQQAIDAQIARSKKFAAQAGFADPYETYFPGLKADKVKNFVESTRSLKVGSEGYRKEFQNLLKDEEMVRNPAEAFAKREWEMAKDRIVRDELGSIVKDFGKGVDAFKTEDEALKAGYRAIKDKGIYGKVVGYLQEADARALGDLVRPEFVTIDNIARATGFDAITSLFKKSVTGLFVPFHVRNYVSGLVQNFEAVGKEALDPRIIALGNRLALRLAKGEQIAGGAVTELGGKSLDLGKAMKAFTERFDTSSSYIADIADATSGKLTKTDSLPFRAARAVGSFIETQQKATAYLASLAQGKTIEQGLDAAARAGFDYRALTSFESKVLRRLIPFYSFTRKNIELQLRTLGENPQRVNQVLSIFDNLGKSAGGDMTADEKKALPDYLKSSLGFKLGTTADGLMQYIGQFGTPIEAFADLLNGNPVFKAISQMNPLIKAPVEIGIGKDSFRQRDLQDVYDAREYKLAPQFIKDMLDITEVQKPVYGKDKSGKVVKTGTRTEYIADPVKLLLARSLFTSRGATYLDQVFGGDLQGFAKLLKTTTGVKPQTVDVEKQLYFQEQDKKRALEDTLIKHGAIKEFRSTYTPKK